MESRGLTIRHRPFIRRRKRSDKSTPNRRSRKAIGRRGERIAQKWLSNHLNVNPRPATLIAEGFGTWPVDLYDDESAWVYEVKMGRISLPKAIREGFDMARILAAGLVNGVTMISVEHKGRIGFTKAAETYLRKANVGMFLIRPGSTPGSRHQTPRSI